jgi:hypothetical protein
MQLMQPSAARIVQRERGVTILCPSALNGGFGSWLRENHSGVPGRKIDPSRILLAQERFVERANEILLLRTDDCSSRFYAARVRLRLLRQVCDRSGSAPTADSPAGTNSAGTDPSFAHVSRNRHTGAQDVVYSRCAGLILYQKEFDHGIDHGDCREVLRSL